MGPPWSLLSADVTCVLVLPPPQDLLGDVVYVELPDVGMTVKKGGVWGCVGMCRYCVTVDVCLVLHLCKPVSQ